MCLVKIICPEEVLHQAAIVLDATAPSTDACLRLSLFPGGATYYNMPAQEARKTKKNFFVLLLEVRCCVYHAPSS